MVKEYLEKQQEIIIGKKLEILSEINGLNNEYKETVEMIKLLEESENLTFEEFTPRVVNRFSSEKIIELKKKQLIIKHNIEVREEQLEQVLLEIYEINAVVKSQNRMIQNMDLLSAQMDECLEMVYTDVYQTKNMLKVMKEKIAQSKEIM